MTDDSLLPFDLPAVRRKKLTVAFDATAPDRGPSRGRVPRQARPLSELMKTRMFAICCGHANANDLDRLRHDPLLKMAVGRVPETGEALCSQPP